MNPFTGLVKAIVLVASLVGSIVICGVGLMLLALVFVALLPWRALRVLALALASLGDSLEDMARATAFRRALKDAVPDEDGPSRLEEIRQARKLDRHLTWWDSVVSRDAEPSLCEQVLQQRRFNRDLASGNL